MGEATVDLPVGLTMRSQGRTIGEGEFALLSDLTWMTGEIHTNREHMLDDPSGERILGGPIVAAIVASLAAHSPLSRTLNEDYGVRIVAALGLDARLGAPVLPGDTLWAETEVAAVRPSSSRPGQAVLTIRDRGFNQRDQQVVEIERTVLVRQEQPHSG